jgi:putative transposase
MPNHFHLMVYVNNLKVEEQLVLSPGATSSRARTIALNENPHNKYDPRLISFNKSIGIMLASYTRAINNQILSSGSLFRQETKAINISKPESVTSAWFNSLGLTYINAQNPERQYPNICFNYINKNPVKDGLVQKPEDWEFSSFLDITGRRNGKLINRNRIKEYGLVLL